MITLIKYKILTLKRLNSNRVKGLSNFYSYFNVLAGFTIAAFNV